MDREINEMAARKRLAPLVAALYAGATLAFNQERGPTRQLCYRGAGEFLPMLPRAECLAQALSGGLYLSIVAQNTAGEIVDQRWLHFGGFDLLDIALRNAGAPESSVTQLAMQLSLRRAASTGDVYATPIDIHPGVREPEARPSAPAADAPATTLRADRARGG